MTSKITSREAKHDMARKSIIRLCSAFIGIATMAFTSSIIYSVMLILTAEALTLLALYLMQRRSGVSSN